MADHTLTFTADPKRGIYRKGRSVAMVLEFKTEYEAMQAFDVWSMEEITLHHKGPVVSKEEFDG